MSRLTPESHRLVTETCLTMVRNRDHQWSQRLCKLEAETNLGTLSPKVVSFVCLATHVSVTGLNPEQVKRHIRGALDNGASVEEVWAVLKLCSVLGIHAIAVAAPILESSLTESGKTIDSNPGGTPTINTLRERGTFNHAWSTIETWDPEWLDSFLAVGLDPSIETILGTKTQELLYIAIDASVTHLYSPGTRRHIDAALRAGVQPVEILEVLKLVSIQGLDSIEVGLDILDEVCRERELALTT